MLTVTELARIASRHATRMADAMIAACARHALETGEKLDHDRFRRDLGGVREAYEEILNRLEGCIK